MHINITLILPPFSIGWMHFLRIKKEPSLHRTYDAALNTGWVIFDHHLGISDGVLRAKKYA